MDVKKVIRSRRAYRSLVPIKITIDLIRDLSGSARLSPSCFNNQPWRFIFVHEPVMLKSMREALSSGNKWAYSASMIIVLFGRKEDDCIIKDRVYYKFDCGLAAGFLILRATELGLVAHPIAGFSPKKTREILGIPDDYRVVTLIVVGKHSDKINPVLSEKQIKSEKNRPERNNFEEFVFINKYGDKLRE